jgi:PAS domain S-box-containing protein
VQTVGSDAARAVIDLAHNAFVSVGDDGRVRDWNPCAEELFGYPRDEALGADVSELIVPVRYRERHRAALNELLQAGPEAVMRRGMHLKALRRDGAELPVEVSVTVVPGDGGPVLHAWVEDVSERAALLQELEAQLRGGQPGFAQIFDALAEAVTIRDRNDHIIYANRAACRHMGFDTLEELQERPPRVIMDDYLVTGEDGAELTMDDVPSVRLLRGGQAEPLVMRTIHRVTGQVRWNLLKAAALHDASGDTVAAVTVIEDITREKQAELRDHFLAEASATLMSSLDYEETLRNVAWLAVPEIADWCAVDLVDEAGSRQQLVVAHRDPRKLELAAQIRRFDSSRVDPERGVGRVLRTGVSEIYSEITDEMLAAGAVNDEHLALLREVGFRSALLVPLRARGRSLGVMTLVSAESLRRFDDSDRDLAEQVAATATVAVENARLATARREVAQTLQRSLLPEVVPQIEGWETAALYRSADATEEVEVGGDFYDFVRVGDAWLVLIGDVTGKGLQAAAMTSLVRHGASFLSRYEQSPGRILAGLNEALRERDGLWLCTAICARLHDGGVVLCSAGHPPPFIVRADGRIREIGAAGPILGAWTGEEPPDRAVAIGPDETLVLYTDGLLDARGESERFGTERLRRVLADQAGKAPQELLAALEAELERFSSGPRSDDTAAVALRPLPVPGRTAPPATAGGHTLRTI